MIEIKDQIERLLQTRYSLEATINLFEEKNLTNREKEILTYGFAEGRKQELLILLYDFLNKKEGRDFIEYLSERISFKIPELNGLTGDKDYSKLIEYLKKMKLES